MDPCWQYKTIRAGRGRRTPEGLPDALYEGLTQVKVLPFPTPWSAGAEARRPPEPRGFRRFQKVSEAAQNLPG
jgi:hypothetical protein